MTIDYAKARELMVEQQVRPWDVLDARVLDALAVVPRDAFVPAAHRALAYADAALPLGHGESMMKPVVEGRMLQALDAAGGRRRAGDRHRQRLPHRLPGPPGARSAQHRTPSPTSPTPRARAWTRMGLGGNVRDRDRRRLRLATPTAASTRSASPARSTRFPPRFLQWLRPGGRLFVVRGVSPAMEAVLVRNDVNGAAHRIVVRNRPALPRRRRAGAAFEF